MFFAKVGDILDQDVLGWWIVSIVLLLDLLEEYIQVILDLARLGLNQAFLEEWRWYNFDFWHKNTLLR